MQYVYITDEIRHSVALISSSATCRTCLYPTKHTAPPFGSTDIIECNEISPEMSARADMPPFGSTDIIECNSPPAAAPPAPHYPPFGSTDIIECNVASEPKLGQQLDRHSVALISSSATAWLLSSCSGSFLRHSVALISSSATHRPPC